MAGALIRGVAVLAAVQLLLLAGAVKLRAREHNEAQSFVYDYSHRGQDWVMGQCASRTRQSPVNFQGLGALPPPASSFKYNYQRVGSPTLVTNNGKTLSLVLKDLGIGGINFADAWYDLMYVNVHAQSEHTFDGQHKPLELHMVHKRYDSDALLLVAVLIDSATPPSGVGATPPTPWVPPSTQEANYNAVVQQFLKLAPPPAKMQVEVPGDEILAPDLGTLLDGSAFVGYSGSTTAPPCSETVAWLVRETPVMASSSQVQALHDAIYLTNAGFGNYRSTMPIGGEIIRYAAVRETAPSMAYNFNPNVPAPEKADVQLSAMKWAKDALRVATASLDYVRNLDQRLHRAAEAQAEAFAPSPALAPAPAPVSAGEAGASPTAGVNPEKASEAMAVMVAQAAKEAVNNATQVIAREAQTAALSAARQATKTVLDNMALRDKVAQERAFAAQVSAAR